MDKSFSIKDVMAREIKVELLILGSEAAGAKTAIEAQDAGADVLVVTKGLVGRNGNTIIARGGIQAPLGHMDPRDNPDVFFEDVIKGGEYLNNQKLAERLTALSMTEVPKMEKWGARFVKNGDKYFQTRFPGSSYARGLMPYGNNGGVEWRRAFRNQFKRLNTRYMEDIFITSLLLNKGEVAGAMGISLRDGEPIVFKAKKTVLATGGACAIYKYTDGSRTCTGDGMMIAYRAGAELMDMEFQQFFPYNSYSPPLEMSNFPAEIRYNLHARFYNSLGETFMEKYLSSGKEFGLRDETSRAIYLENFYGRGSPHGGAWLSINHLPSKMVEAWRKKAKSEFYLRRLEKAGIDIYKDGIEAGPGCHYTMGGVRVNENCETNLPRLYAAGEAASGQDGAERIDGGPAITWCLTMGYIIGKDAAKTVKEIDWLEIDREQVARELSKISTLWNRSKGIPGFKIKKKIQDTMWDKCCLVRDEKGLTEGLKIIQQLKQDELPQVSVPAPSKTFNQGLTDALEAQNMADLAEMIITAASMRKETRKSHYRTDYLKLDNQNWLKNIIIKKGPKGMDFSTVNPVITRMRPSEK